MIIFLPISIAIKVTLTYHVLSLLFLSIVKNSNKNLTTLSTKYDKIVKSDPGGTRLPRSPTSRSTWLAWPR